MTKETVTRFATRVAPVALGVALSVYLAADSIVQRSRADFVSESFRPSFWQPWHALRAGVDPYPDALHPLANGPPFLYPPLSAELTLPLSWLPYGVAAAVFTAGLVLAAVLVMWALDVRAPALVALWVASAVVVDVAAGNATMFVLLAAVLVWRWRDRALPAAAVLTAAVCTKLFVWPFLLWLVMTRRYRPALYAIVASSILILLSWAVIGFAGFTDYPILLGNATRQLGQLGLLAYALAVKSLSHELALVVTLTVAALLVAGAIRRRDDDLASYTLIAVATLYATPIVWGDYFGLLIVPAALYGGWLWAAVPLLWIGRLADAGHSRPTWLIAGYIAITALFAVRALRSEHAAEELSPEGRPEQVVPTLVEAG